MFDSFFIYFLFPLYLAIQAILKVREAEFKMDLEKGFEVDRSNWSRALCSDRAGSTGLANRASVPTVGVFSDK